MIAVTGQDRAPNVTLKPQGASFGPSIAVSIRGIGAGFVNPRLTWQKPAKDLSISLEGTNLTNKYYYVTDFDLRATGAGLDKAQPGRPRGWAVTVKKSFGGSPPSPPPLPPAPPPPPPPPTPPPPAMQTCPDGTHVLASQACPVPLPPTVPRTGGRG